MTGGFVPAAKIALRAGAVSGAVALAFATAGCGGGSGETPASGRSGTEATGKAGSAAVGTTVTPAAEGGVGPGGSPGQVRRTTRIQVAGHQVTVEIADTPELRRRGLMHRDSLPQDHGMLFVYPESRILSFWMVNTRMPLDIAFIDRSGVIVDIQRMEPQSDEQHTSEQPAMYALEMRAGWFADHGVEVGARVQL